MSARMSGPSLEVVAGAGIGGLFATAAAWWQAMSPPSAALLAFAMLCLSGWAATKWTGGRGV